MTSYFSDPYHIRMFATGFDLIGSQLPELKIADIAVEIEEHLEGYPDDRNAVLALDALYDALDERDDAIVTDACYRALTDSSLFALREARHLVLTGEREEADTVLDEVIRLSNKESLVRQACSLIAHGRRNDRDGFTKAWKQLLEQYNPGAGTGSVSLLADLPFREQIEGIGLLFRLGITRGRENEIIALVSGFSDYLCDLTDSMMEEAVVDGFTDSLPSFGVIAAISSGMVKATEDILDTCDPVTRGELEKTVQPDLDGIRKTGREMQVLETLKYWSFNPEKPAQILLSTLREESGNDDELIGRVLDILDADYPPGQYRQIRSLLPMSGPAERDPLNRELGHMIDESRFSEALAFARQHALLAPESEASEYLALQACRETGGDGEAYSFLLGRMETGTLLMYYPLLFELACTLCRMDELQPLRPVFESRKVPAGTHLLDAWERMKKKDVKGGLVLIERAGREGMSADDVLLFSTRFLLASGFPKRVEGFCEKMFRRGLPDAKIYPLLIRAYRDLGREDDAQAAEVAFRTAGPGSG
ncbi:MAG: hypothetical protein M0Q92_13230 [Methanoregula sp.]|jgi:hypothetical protein|nr:hypothetical protein [Methanoregula sp.]